MMKTILMFSAIALCSYSCINKDIEEFTVSDKEVAIFPDYKNIILPGNIAPLNFLIKTEAEDFSVSFDYGDQKVKPRVRGNLVQTPVKLWQKLMLESVNDTVRVSVYIKDTSGWEKCKSFYWYVSGDSIDSYLSYRLIDPGYERWSRMGIYMRNMTSFKQTAIFENSLTENNCMNCHNYKNNDPDYFMLHVRGNPGGTIINTNGSMRLFNTKTDYTMSAGVYPSWHPSGKLIAMSVNRVYQFFHNIPDKTIEVADRYSDLIVFNIDKKEITTSPQISTKDKETMPVWDPKGEYLYFIKTIPTHDTSQLADFKYDLYRIKYDINTNVWGQVEPVLEVSKIDKSMTFPKFSPSGRFILFTMTEYGNFTIHHNDADLYMYDLQTKISFPLTAANSEYADSYHSWSSSGKWIVFSSKRLDGVCGRPYISHIDENGKASKAFVLPQKNPEFYTNFTKSFNVPELMTRPVKIPKYKIRDLLYSEPETVTFDESINLDALSGATKFSVDSLRKYMGGDDQYIEKH